MAKKENLEEQNLNYDKNSLYFGYNARVSILIVLFTILAIICGLLAYKIINYQEENNVKLIEVGRIEHSAVLKDNNIYDKKEISEKDGLTYLASLIDKIKLEYSYRVNYDKEVEGEYYASLKGQLIIYNPKTNTNYFIKDLDFVEEDKDTIESKRLEFYNDVEIDYNEYNKIAKEFKSKYNKDSEARLDVFLDFSTSISPKDCKTFKRINSKLLATIPLGKEEVEIIKMPVDNTKIVDYKQTKTTIYSIILESLLIIFVLFLIIVFYKLNKLLSKIDPRESEYDRELKRILEEYDNIIVNVSILPDENKYKKVVIEDFKELLDLNENVKEPIRYIEIAPHNKSYFFIKHKDEVFVYTLKNTSRER